MSTTIPTAALNQHIAILGKTGSGKSYAAKGIVETLLADKRQVCILDPTSAWYGLRLAADGKSRGFDVVLLGGQHADIPLAQRSGAAVARLVTEQGANVVLDSSGFTVGEYTRWFIDFAGTLFTTIRSPLHLVIDEAHHFMPQGKSPDVDAGKMLHAGNRLMSGGRSKGVRGMLITQRPAKLHKDSLSCADTLIAMRVIAPQDRAAIKDWIDGSGDPAQGKEVLDSLAKLQRGEGWVWYPEGGHLERVKFPKIKTYDSSATPTHGAKAGPKVSEIDLGEVRRAMAEAVKEAEENDPKLLRKQLAELKKQLSDKSPDVDPEAISRAVSAAIEQRDRELQQALAERESIIGSLKGRMVKAAELLHVNGEAIAKTGIPRAPSIDPAAVRAQHGAHTHGKTGRVATTRPQRVAAETSPAASTFDARSRKAVRQPEESPALAESQLTTPQRKILSTVAMLNRRGLIPNREMVARWIGIHPNGGSYGANLGRLRSDGYLNGFTLTEAGHQAADTEETGLDAALRALDGEPKRNILRALIDAGRALSREELADALGLHPNGGSYGANLGWLRTMGLITERGPIAVTAALYE